MSILAGQKISTKSVMSDLMAMVSANVCCALPPATDDFDPEEDEPVLEPACLASGVRILFAIHCETRPQAGLASLASGALILFAVHREFRSQRQGRQEVR